MLLEKSSQTLTHSQTLTFYIEILRIYHREYLIPQRCILSYKNHMIPKSSPQIIYSNTFPDPSSPTLFKSCIILNPLEFNIGYYKILHILNLFSSPYLQLLFLKKFLDPLYSPEPSLVPFSNGKLKTSQPLHYLLLCKYY